MHIRCSTVSEEYTTHQDYSYCNDSCLVRDETLEMVLVVSNKCNLTINDCETGVNNKYTKDH